MVISIYLKYNFNTNITNGKNSKHPKLGKTH